MRTLLLFLTGATFASAQSILWPVPRQFTQADQPACVSVTVAHALVAGPIRRTDINQQWVWGLHSQLSDDGIFNTGEAVHWLQANGYISGSNRWTTLAQIKQAVMSYGPVIFAHRSFQGMATPVGDVLSPSGEQRGRHVFLLRGYNPENGFFTVRNTNGSPMEYIHKDHVRYLLELSGDRAEGFSLYD